MINKIISRHSALRRVENISNNLMVHGDHLYQNVTRSLSRVSNRMKVLWIYKVSAAIKYRGSVITKLLENIIREPLKIKYSH